MKRRGLRLWSVGMLSVLLSVAALLAGGGTGYAEEQVVYRPSDEVLLSMSPKQARDLILARSGRNEPVVTIHNLPPMRGNLIRSIQVDPDKVTWVDDIENGIYYINTAWLVSTEISVIGSGDRFYVKSSRGRWEPHGGNWKPSKATENGVGFWITHDKNESISLANAFYVLKRYAEGYKEEDYRAAEAAFATDAKKYREAAVKPELPEDVQRYRVAAEDAFKNKEFQKALGYYRKGLAIQPLWPQGQFNAAVLAGELQQYNWAITHMKHYLELAPDAQNAKAARERLYLWEIKVKEAQ